MRDGPSKQNGSSSHNPEMIAGIRFFKKIVVRWTQIWRGESSYIPEMIAGTYKPFFKNSEMRAPAVAR